MGSILAARGRCIMTQVLPRRKRMWSLSMRSSVQGPVSAAALAICRSTVFGRRPRKGDCSAKLRGAADVMSLRERVRFKAGAAGAGVSLEPGASVARDTPLEVGVGQTSVVWLGMAGLLKSRRPGALVASGAWGARRVCAVSGFAGAGNHTAMDVRRVLLGANCMVSWVLHQTNTPARCRPAITRPTLAWLRRRWTFTRHRHAGHPLWY